MSTYEILNCPKCKSTGKGEHPNSFCKICIGKGRVMVCFKCGMTGCYTDLTKMCAYCETVHVSTARTCAHDSYCKIRLNNGNYCKSCDSIVDFDTRRCTHDIIKIVVNGKICINCSEVLHYFGKDEAEDEDEDEDEDDPPPKPYRSKRQRCEDKPLKWTDA